MIKYLASNGKLVVSIYILLTIIKLFTADIYLQREEDPTIYFKFRPTIQNVFGGSDKSISVDKHRHSWYDKGHYWEIFHTNGGGARSIIGDIYNVLIVLWWVSSAGLIIYAIWKVLKL